jgi:hypothetical protein
MGLFTFTALFVGWGFAAWVGVLLVLVVADAIWTNGLATSYLHATSMVLEQIWNALGLFFNFIRALYDGAPHSLRMVIFFAALPLVLGFVVNWFLASGIVCAGGTPYAAGSITSAWFAGSLPTNANVSVDDVNVSSVTITENDASKTYGSGDSDKNSGFFKELFSKSFSMSRETYVQQSIAADAESFKAVDNTDKTVTYVCRDDSGAETGNVRVGLFGLDNVFSVQTLMIVYGVALLFAIIAFLKGITGR